MRDDQIRELVNRITDIARQYGKTDQLRARIQTELVPDLKKLVRDGNEARGEVEKLHKANHDLTLDKAVLIMENRELKESLVTPTVLPEPEHFVWREYAGEMFQPDGHIYRYACHRSTGPKDTQVGLYTEDQVRALLAQRNNKGEMK